MSKKNTRNNKTIKQKSKSKSKTAHNDMIRKFIEKSFSLKLTLKMVHWTTKVYAIHKITDKGMQKLNPLVDSFVEAFLGKKDYTLKQNTIKNVHIETVRNKEDLVKFINNNISYLISLNKYISNAKHSDLVSIRDDIIGELNVMKYLLNLEK